MRNRRHTANDKHLSRIIAHTRGLCRDSAQMLDEPRPDTFLGRMTYQPFSRENDPKDSPATVPDLAESVTQDE